MHPSVRLLFILPATSTAFLKCSSHTFSQCAGREWNTAEHHKREIRPAVETVPGAIIKPMKATKVSEAIRGFCDILSFALPF
jgi:hypothetical protein